MAAQSLPEDQLLELLTQLQKTTPDQARAILNAQPAIGYALVPLMARMGIVNLEVLQKTLSTYVPAAQSAPASTPAPVPAAPVIPPHLAQVQTPYQHHPTPPPATHTPLYGSQQPTPVPAPYPGYPPQHGQQYAQPYGHMYGHGAPPPMQQQHQQWAGQQGPPAAPPPGASMLGALGNIPDDQREMIMRVVAMTPEQIHRLPPQDRAITMQLRQTLGLPTE